MDSENRSDFESALATFAHPRYELVATGEVFEGTEAVMGYYATTRAALPDQRNELRALYHADDAVIAEVELFGTHLGTVHGLPATGRSVRCRMVAVFLFEGEGIVCERVYFDMGTILSQLGLVGRPLTVM